MSPNNRHIGLVSASAAIVTVAILGGMTKRAVSLEESAAVVQPTRAFSAALQVSQSSGDQARLEAILAELSRGVVRIDELLGVPVAAQSAELQQLVAELASSRDELRGLRNRFADDYPPIQALLTRISAIERQDIPRVVQSLIEQLSQA